MRVVEAPVADVPSPNAQELDTIVPSLSLDVEESKDATSPALVDVNLAVGGTFTGAAAVTVTELVVTLVAPSSSVTVKLIVYVPEVA